MSPASQFVEQQISHNHNQHPRGRRFSFEDDELRKVCVCSLQSLHYRPLSLAHTVTHHTLQSPSGPHPDALRAAAEAAGAGPVPVSNVISPPTERPLVSLDAVAGPVTQVTTSYSASPPSGSPPDRPAASAPMDVPHIVPSHSANSTPPGSGGSGGGRGGSASHSGPRRPRRGSAAEVDSALWASKTPEEKKTSMARMFLRRRSSKSLAQMKRAKAAAGLVSPPDGSGSGQGAGARGSGGGAGGGGRGVVLQRPGLSAINIRPLEERDHGALSGTTSPSDALLSPVSRQLQRGIHGKVCVCCCGCMCKA